MSQNHLSEAQFDGLLDDLLAASEMQEVKAHLESCGSCQATYLGLATARELLRASDEEQELPPGLESRLRLALDREDEASESSERSEANALVLPFPAKANEDVDKPIPWTRILLPLAALLILALSALDFWPTREALQNPVDAAFADYQRLEDPQELASLAVESPKELEQRWAKAKLDVGARVIDLSAMGTPLIGGGPSNLAGHDAALAVYRGTTGLLLCWMFRGEEQELPEAAEEREHNGFLFRIYHQEGRTLVVWREGEVLCALAGSGDASQVIDLAFAKAMA